MKNYYQYMKSVDIGVLPSRSEGIAPSIIEFMECGVPIVATNVGGTPEVITDSYNGILVEKNPKSIAKGILNLYNNPQLMNKLSNNGKKYVSQFELEVVFNKYISLFKKITQI